MYIVNLYIQYTLYSVFHYKLDFICALFSSPSVQGDARPDEIDMIWVS